MCDDNINVRRPTVRERLNKQKKKNINNVNDNKNKYE